MVLCWSVFLGLVALLFLALALVSGYFAVWLRTQGNGEKWKVGSLIKVGCLYGGESWAW